jgi:alpha/beta superfamily hydrolase
MFYRSLIGGLMGLLSLVVLASDLEKEKRWEAQITDALLDGEAIHLQDDHGDFLAISTPANDGNTDKVAIIMHGTGVHPDWPTVVQPLRIGLSQRGWHTLSIQMPVLANAAEHKDYAAIYGWVPGRLDAAIRYARAAGGKTVVLIAHSQGATMAAYYLAKEHMTVEGFIAIGMGPGITHGPMDNLQHLRTMKLPLLDLYGSADLPEVVASAAQRKTIASRASPQYMQVMLQGADHFFDGEEQGLLKTTADWLDHLVAKKQSISTR